MSEMNNQRFTDEDFAPVGGEIGLDPGSSRQKTTYWKDVWRNFCKNKVAVVSLMIIVLLLPLSAPAEEPALSFSKPEKGRTIYLGKDDTQSSLLWKVLDTDEKRILLITRNTALRRSRSLFPKSSMTSALRW